MRELIACKNCKGEFYDEYNLICLATLDYCLLCANKKLNKDTIKEGYHVE